MKLQVSQWTHPANTITIHCLGTFYMTTLQMKNPLPYFCFYFSH